MPACESKLASRSSRKASDQDCTHWVGPGLGDRMLSLVVDRGPMLRVLGWALTRMRGSRDAEKRLCVEQSRELFSNIRGRGGASNVCFHS